MVEISPIIRGGIEGPWPSGRAKRVVVGESARSLPEWRTLSLLTGDLIRGVRHRARITASELAAAIDCPPDTVLRWERGVQMPSMASLLAVSMALDCPIGELLPPEVRSVTVIRRRVDDERLQQREELVKAMHECGGVVAHVAKSLGVHDSVVTRRLRVHELEHLRVRPRSRPGQGKRVRSKSLRTQES